MADRTAAARWVALAAASVALGPAVVAAALPAAAACEAGPVEQRYAQADAVFVGTPTRIDDETVTVDVSDVYKGRADRVQSVEQPAASDADPTFSGSQQYVFFVTGSGATVTAQPCSTQPVSDALLAEFTAVGGGEAYRPASPAPTATPEGPSPTPSAVPTTSSPTEAASSAGRDDRSVNPWAAVGALALAGVVVAAVLVPRRLRARRGAAAR